MSKGISSYEVGSKGTYASSGYAPDSWDEGQYQSALKKTLNRYMRSGVKGVAWVGEMLGWPADQLMKNVGGTLARTLDDLNIWHPAWDDPQSREFAWHNIPTMAAAAAVPWSIAKAVYENPGLIGQGDTMVGAGMGPLMLKASEIYAAEVETFGKKHPEFVDEIIKLSVADPLLLLGPLINIAKAPMIAKDLAAIGAIVKEARDTKQGVLALAKLQGKPLPESLLKSVMNSGNTPEQAAQSIYTYGLRPVREGQDFMAGVRMPYFRRASTLVPEEMRDLAMEWPHIKNAAWEEHRQAIANMKDAIAAMDPEEVKDISRVLDSVHTPVGYTPQQAANQIRSEMSQAILSGQWDEAATKSGRSISSVLDRRSNTIWLNPDQIAADFVSKAWTAPKVAGVNPLAGDAFKTVGEWRKFLIEHEYQHTLIPRGSMNAGEYENAINLAALNGEFHKLASTRNAGLPMVRESSVLRSGHTAANFYPTLDHAPSARVIEAAAEYRSMTKAGHLKGAPYMANLTPDVLKNKKGVFDPLRDLTKPWAKPKMRPWDNPRTSNDMKADFNELSSWARRVFLREGVNTPEAATGRLNRIKTIMTGMEVPKLENAEVLRGFAVKVEDRLGNLRALKGAAEKAGQANQVERFENAITETQALADAILTIGEKNPKILDDAPMMEKIVKRGLSYVRLGQTLWNPGWYSANAMEGAARTALATGDAVIDPVGAFSRGHAPIRGIDGSLMDLTHGNIRHQSDVALESFNQRLGNISDRVDRYYQQIVGGHEYEKRVAFYRSKGEPEASVHAFAKADAMEKVKAFFPDLSDSSQFINDMAPAFTYLKHNVYYNTEPLLKWAASSPTEAIFAKNMLEVQYDSVHSDRYGNLRIPGTDRAVNPLDMTGARRIARLVADPAAVIQEGDLPAVKLMKLAQVGTGGTVAPIHWVQKQLGMVSPLSPDVGSPQLDLGGDLTRHFTGVSAPALMKGTVTGQLKETPEFFRELAINRYIASEKLANNTAEGVEPVTTEQAAALVDKVAAENGIFGFLTGIRPVHFSAGMEKLDALIDYYNNDLEKLPNSAVAREQMRNDIPALNGVVAVHQSLDDRIRNTVEMIKQAQGFDDQIPVLKEATDLEKAKLLKAAPTGLYEKLLNLWEGVKKDAEAIKDSIRENISVYEGAPSGEAAAADFTIPISTSPLIRNGKFIIQQDQKMMPDDYINAAGGDSIATKKRDLGLTTDRDTKLAIIDINNAESNAEIIKRVNRYGEGLKNFILEPDNRKVENIARIANVINDPDTGNGPMNTISKRKMVASALRDYAMGAGSGTDVKNMSVKNVQALVASGKLRGAGLTPQAWDSSAIIAAQQLINPTAVMMVHNKKMTNDFPYFNEAMANLLDATRQPQKMDGVLDDIRARVAMGASGQKGADALPADFWKQVDGSPRFPNLYENVGVAASFLDAKKVLEHVVKNDRNGRPTAVNPAALFEIGLDNKYADLAPYIQAARANYYGPAYANALNQFFETLSPQNEALLNVRLGVDNGQIQSYFRNVTNLSGGEHGDFLKSIIDSVSLPPAAPVGQPAQQTGLLAPVRPGELGTPIEAGGGVMRYRPMPEPTAEAANLSDSRAGWFTNAPGFRYESPAQIITAGLTQYRQDFEIRALWDNAVAEGRTPTYANGMPMTEEPRVPGSPVSYIAGQASSQVASGGTVADINLAGQAIGAVNAGAQGVYRDLQLTGDVEGGGDGAAAMYGLNAFANTYSNPGSLGLNLSTFGAYGIYVGVKAGLGFGKEDDARRAQREAQAAENAQRIELQRQQFEERLRQQSIQDIRTREQALSRALVSGGGMSPAQRQQVQPRLAAFQRRPTFQSRIGLVDAVERAIGSAIKPRY